MDTTDNMRVFIAVVAAGGFTAAANRLNISTAKVSRSVSHLESHLRTRLLHRSTRQQMLTEAGARYLGQCKKIIEWIDVAEDEARSAAVVPSGTLRIYAMLGFGHSDIVSAVLRFRERHHSINVELTFSDAALDMIEGRYDTALLLASALPDSMMVAQTLGSVSCVACASPDYLKRFGSPSTVDDLAGHACLRLNAPNMPDGTWTLAGKEAAEKIRSAGVSLSFNHESALLAAVQGGFGIGLLPATAALPSLRNGRLVRVLTGLTLQKLNLHVMYPSRQFVDAKLKAWIDFLREQIPPALAVESESLAAMP
ncbi:MULTISPECIES: LysR family transcriptional regulator [Burkholderiaceae]|uniref:HTH lysR-type domain-containing protein n=1 Tax=Paraburkholderia aromaticivorans TaxID=2026199 RepID=A0A248VZQ4_9BURK|nr:LysR family transcriptional regulator [Paraburkholderia aromaticivorans]ASW04343.1 hypothetical protein CJU94_40085 [Paraburkholderia aromaticivorans]